MSIFSIHFPAHIHILQARFTVAKKSARQAFIVSLNYSDKCSTLNANKTILSAFVRFDHAMPVCYIMQDFLVAHFRKIKKEKYTHTYFMK